MPETMVACGEFDPGQTEKYAVLISVVSIWSKYFIVWMSPTGFEPGRYMPILNWLTRE